MLARAGWSRAPRSVDKLVVTGSRTRESQNRTNTPTVAIPALEARRTDAYVRAGYGDPDDGPWAQLIAG